MNLTTKTKKRELKTERNSVTTQSSMSTTKYETAQKTNKESKPKPVYKPLKVMLLKAFNIRSTVYQRDLDRANIESIKENFDINRLGVLKVALRDDGYYYLIDGQHRYVAIVELFGDKVHIACEVVDNSEEYIQKVALDKTYKEKELTSEEVEARLFSTQYSNTKKLTAMELFKANIVGKCKRELELVEIADKYGFKINYETHPTVKNNVLICLNELVKTYDRFGLDIIEEIFDIERQAYDGDGRALNSKMIKALAYFINKYKDVYNKKKLIQKLKSFNVPDEIKLASEYATRTKLSSKPVSPEKALVEAIVNAYNKGCRKEYRLEI